jgi:hypothetical protein
VKNERLFDVLIEHFGRKWETARVNQAHTRYRRRKRSSCVIPIKIKALINFRICQNRLSVIGEGVVGHSPWLEKEYQLAPPNLMSLSQKPMFAVVKAGRSEE